jgi:DNA primase
MNKHTDQELTDLKKSVFLPAVIGERIKLIKKGAEYIGACPFHDDKNAGSFTVYEKNGIWMWTCFPCSVTSKENGTGNVFQFLQKFDKITFDEAVEKANYYAGRNQVDQTFASSLAAKQEELTFDFSKLLPAREALHRSSLAIEMFLAKRNLDIETLESLNWGFVQSAKAVSSEHPNRDDGWLLIPTIEGDKVISLKYRSIADKAFLRKSGMRTCLYNLQTIVPGEPVFLVEGEFDAAVLEQAGFHAVSLPSATYNPTPTERDALLKASVVYLAGDSDVPGQAAMMKLWNEFRNGAYKVTWPAGSKDANDTLTKECKGDNNQFRALVDELATKAHQQPLPHVFDMAAVLNSVGGTKPMDNPARLHMPWKTIDRWTPILPGDVLVVSASETGMGKSAWVQDILLCNSREFNKVVVNYSAEIPPESYARRMAASLLQKRREDIDEADFRTAAKMMGAKFYNGYKPGANYQQVVELLQWAKMRLGADILVVDHIHFLTRGERDENKAQADFMRKLKDLAVDYSVIVIAVSQPRKQNSMQRNRQIVTQDIKGSEAAGSDASQVFLIHRKRKDVTADEQPLFENETKVILDKSRESETKNTKLMFKGEFCKFYDLAYGDDQKEEAL